jgi:hypothetical protein
MYKATKSDYSAATLALHTVAKRFKVLARLRASASYRGHLKNMFPRIAIAKKGGDFQAYVAFVEAECRCCKIRAGKA